MSGRGFPRPDTFGARWSVPYGSSRVPTFPKLSLRAQRGNFPQTVIASAARQSIFPKLSLRAQRGNLPQTVIASAARQFSPNCHCERSAAIFPKLSLRAQRGNFPQTVIASAARQSRRGNERRSWNEIAIRQRRTSLLAMTNWVRVSHFGSLSEARFTGFIGCAGLGATLPSDDLNPDNPSNPGNPASDIPPPESGYA